VGIEELDGARYLSLTTFKRDGTAVACPVWITGEAGTYVLITGNNAWKTRRLARNPAVEARVCDMRGRCDASATTFRGTGEVLTTPDDVRDAERQLAKKYGWQYKVAKLVDRIRPILRPSHAQIPVAIRLSLTA
jgi:PPOX class probable F420-dependent enzyme